MSISPSPALATRFQDLIPPAWPASAHTSAVQHHDYINWHRCLERLRLGPWRNPIEQHLSERPDVIGQSGRHRWRTGPPHLGGAMAIGGNGLSQRLAQT